MPWKEAVLKNLRLEFVHLVSSGGASLSEGCRRYGISRKCGRKWLERFARQGEAGLLDQSRRPKTSPGRVLASVENAVLELRTAHTAWGGRKLRRALLDEGHPEVPSASTITEVLRRHGKLDAAESSKHQPWQRFERAAPNELWQMDFKGHVPGPDGRCHPLAILDDCSRFSIALDACGDETLPTVKRCLTQAFERYGLPWQMLMDNGAPWGSREYPLTQLTVWLLRLDVRVAHGRAYHPQTQGKQERFNRSFKAELLGQSVPWKLAECQRHFDAWRDLYNWKRPHEALQMSVPGKRYHLSERRFPAQLPRIEYGPGELIRKVQHGGFLSYKNVQYRVPNPLHGYPVALRPHPNEDGLIEVYFCRQRVALLDLKQKRTRPWRQAQDPAPNNSPNQNQE